MYPKYVRYKGERYIRTDTNVQLLIENNRALYIRMHRLANVRVVRGSKSHKLLNDINRITNDIIEVLKKDGYAREYLSLKKKRYILFDMIKKEIKNDLRFTKGDFDDFKNAFNDTFRLMGQC